MSKKLSEGEIVILLIFGVLLLSGGNLGNLRLPTLATLNYDVQFIQPKLLGTWTNTSVDINCPATILGDSQVDGCFVDANQNTATAISLNPNTTYANNVSTSWIGFSLHYRENGICESWENASTTSDCGPIVQNKTVIYQTQTVTVSPPTPSNPIVAWFKNILCFWFKWCN